jgi:hypothetical protein
MNTTQSVLPKTEIERARQQLANLRSALLNLHKSLVDSERVSYEQTVGPIQSPTHFLQLLTKDAWFAWLQQLSQLIVAVDVALEEKEPLSMTASLALEKQTKRLLVASENDENFSGHYFTVLQRDPDVVLAHADVVNLLRGTRPPTTPSGEASRQTQPPMV